MTLYAIGDVQGCARAFDALLEKLSFEATDDRLWLVGDLVNRGPDSRTVLRRVMSLGERVTTVLGNHDLHLLAAAAGIRTPSPTDTFADVLDADDADELIDWLRRRPLLYRDRERRLVLVHAGIPPGWKIKQAERRAREVEDQLSGRDWRAALNGMYGTIPDRWRRGLDASDRIRFTINALTRMRFCDADGRLDFEYSGPPGSQPPHLVPWFDSPQRRSRKWHVVFGHWSALGVMRRKDVTALDSGCIWGRELTAVPLDTGGRTIDVDCG